MNNNFSSDLHPNSISTFSLSDISFPALNSGALKKDIDFIQNTAESIQTPSRLNTPIMFEDDAIMTKHNNFFDLTSAEISNKMTLPISLAELPMVPHSKANTLFASAASEIKNMKDEAAVTCSAKRLIVKRHLLTSLIKKVIKSDSFLIDQKDSLPATTYTLGTNQESLNVSENWQQPTNLQSNGLQLFEQSISTNQVYAKTNSLIYSRISSNHIKSSEANYLQQSFSGKQIGMQQQKLAQSKNVDILQIKNGLIIIINELKLINRINKETYEKIMQIVTPLFQSIGAIDKKNTFEQKENLISFIEENDVVASFISRFIGSNTLEDCLMIYGRFIEIGIKFDKYLSLVDRYILHLINKKKNYRADDINTCEKITKNIDNIKRFQIKLGIVKSIMQPSSLEMQPNISNSNQKNNPSFIFLIGQLNKLLMQLNKMPCFKDEDKLANTDHFDSNQSRKELLNTFTVLMENINDMKNIELKKIFIHEINQMNFPSLLMKCGIEVTNFTCNQMHQIGSNIKPAMNTLNQYFIECKKQCNETKIGDTSKKNHFNKVLKNTCAPLLKYKNIVDDDAINLRQDKYKAENIQEQRRKRSRDAKEDFSTSSKRRFT